MGLLSLVRDYQVYSLQNRNLMQYAALLRPITTVIKVLVLAIIGLVWAESAGYNMTTVLAGLGIGSLAVALAAQKTLENVFGAITLYLARPVKAGDFCKFKGVQGVVEEIGLRSTALRTLENTLVYIPNSEFSSSQVENISSRSATLFHRELRIRLTKSESIASFMSGLRELINGHALVKPESVRVHFKSIEEDTGLLLVYAQIGTADYDEYLSVGDYLNMGVIQLAESSNIELCGPKLDVHLDGETNA